MLTLLLPTAVKAVHMFEHHKHVVCNGSTSTHFHKVDLDCEFQKFQLKQPFTISYLHIDLFIPLDIPVKNVSKYFYIDEYQRLPFSLRGPPYLI